MVNRCAAPEVAEHLFTTAAAVVVRHHSKLDSGRDDAIIIGASSIAHLQHNLSAVKQDPLPRPVVDAINSASETVRPRWPSYFFEL